MARRKKRIEHDNHDRWLVSYADFVTLLFAFFVVMYSISSVNEGKYKVFSSSLNLAFANPLAAAPPGSTVSPQEPALKTMVDRRTARLGERQRKIQERMKNIAGGLSRVMAPMIEQGAVSIVESRRGVVIDISASALFTSGDAVLQSGSTDALKQVAAILAQEEHSIEVEGHTDDIPISTKQFPSNWELSSARASSVVRVLVENGVPAKRLAAVGLASNQPKMPNDSAENRAMNRRVVILIVSPNAERGEGAEE